MQDTIAVRARITGRVQGVFFRAWTQQEAERHGLAGWVRNEPDGSVAALLVGGAPDVSKMVEALWQGPPGAAVTKVEAEETTPAEPHSAFRITG